MSAFTISDLKFNVIAANLQVNFANKGSAPKNHRLAWDATIAAKQKSGPQKKATPASDEGERDQELARARGWPGLLGGGPRRAWLPSYVCARTGHQRRLALWLGEVWEADHHRGWGFGLQSRRRLRGSVADPHRSELDFVRSPAVRKCSHQKAILRLMQRNSGSAWHAPDSGQARTITHGLQRGNMIRNLRFGTVLGFLRQRICLAGPLCGLGAALAACAGPGGWQGAVGATGHKPLGAPTDMYEPGMVVAPQDDGLYSVLCTRAQWFGAADIRAKSVVGRTAIQNASNRISFEASAVEYAEANVETSEEWQIEKPRLMEISRATLSSARPVTECASSILDAIDSGLDVGVIQSAYTADIETKAGKKVRLEGSVELGSIAVDAQEQRTASGAGLAWGLKVIPLQSLAVERFSSSDVGRQSPNMAQTLVGFWQCDRGSLTFTDAGTVTIHYNAVLRSNIEAPFSASDSTVNVHWGDDVEHAFVQVSPDDATMLLSFRGEPFNCTRQKVNGALAAR